MRKLLEIEFKDEIKKSLLTLYALSILTFALFILIRISEQSFFQIGFVIEFIFVVGILRFYIRTHRNRNYALWGLSFIIALYLLVNVLHFTFVDYNIFILYIAFMAGLFLTINCFVMSSPLYFPRVQWWEYDFRYRGDLKATATVNEKASDARVADLRRECISFLSFDSIKLGEKVVIEIPFGDKLFTIGGKLKTIREDIPGRPKRFGLKLILSNESDKKNYLELKKVWRLNNKANIRRKFADYKEAKVAGEL